MKNWKRVEGNWAKINQRDDWINAQLIYLNLLLNLNGWKLNLYKLEGSSFVFKKEIKKKIRYITNIRIMLITSIETQLSPIWLRCSGFDCELSWSDHNRF